ncbi:uncharacterized protein [Primulina eburnea]|uniref:uncharacterized protein n=1 Tax=Primulina eburnea TaxID=1245227 RepID=UPI003C6C7EC8
MELQDADRVRCATFLLTRDARLWWESASVLVNLQTMTWIGFKEVFYCKYFTEEVRSRMTKEFMKQRQGDSSMTEFPILRRDVCVAGPTTYVIVVSRVLAAEHDQRDIESDRQGKRPYQAPQQQRPQFKRSFQGQQGKRSFQGSPKIKGPIPQQKAPQKPDEYPVCPKCDLQHPRQCLLGSESSQKGPDRFRGHTLFLSETFANHLDVKSIGFKVNYSVTVSSREKLSATSVVRDINLELQGHLVYADMIVLPMPEFDILLGMNWLTKNRVLIDFRKKSVLVRPLGMEKFLFEPDRWRRFPHMLSCTQAQRLIHKSCQAFLASIVSALDAPIPSIADVPIVRYFPDVFPDGVTGFPPEREVEFSIDLVPLTSLTKKNDKFVWSGECEKSNDTLKQALITALVLAMSAG